MTPFDPCDCGTCIECIASKKSEVAMTIEERARRILDDENIEWFTQSENSEGVLEDSVNFDGLEKLIIKHLNQACAEAIKEAFKPQWPECVQADKWMKEAYEKGYSDAKEEAAKIAEEYAVSSFGRKIAERIRNMKCSPDSE